MRILRSISILAIVSSLSACAIAPPAEKVEEVGDLRSISSTSDLQTTIIKIHGDPERYCAARQSDVADTRSVGGSIGVSAPGSGEGISEGSSQGALALGGRSPSVLIVREMMYRACELALNLNAGNEQTMEIYKLFMEKTKEITALQTGSGSSALGASASPSAVSAKAPVASGTSSSSSSSSSSNDDTVTDQGVD